MNWHRKNWSKNWSIVMKTRKPISIKNSVKWSKKVWFHKKVTQIWSSSRLPKLWDFTETTSANKCKTYFLSVLMTPKTQKPWYTLSKMAKMTKLIKMTINLRGIRWPRKMHLLAWLVIWSRYKESLRWKLGRKSRCFSQMSRRHLPTYSWSRMKIRFQTLPKLLALWLC